MVRIQRSWVWQFREHVCDKDAPDLRQAIERARNGALFPALGSALHREAAVVARGGSIVAHQRLTFDIARPLIAVAVHFRRAGQHRAVAFPRQFDVGVEIEWTPDSGPGEFGFPGSPARVRHGAIKRAVSFVFLVVPFTGETDRLVRAMPSGAKRKNPDNQEKEEPDNLATSAVNGLREQWRIIHNQVFLETHSGSRPQNVIHFP